MNDLLEKIDNLTFRERGFVLAGLIAVVYILVNLSLLQPLENKRKKAQNDLQSRTSEMVALNAGLQQALEQGRQDPNIANKEKLQRLKQELEVLKNQYKEATSQLVSPNDMSNLLESVLRKTGTLTLRKVTSLGSTPLAVNETAINQSDMNNEQANGENTELVYKHGLRIEFSGNYFATLNYLRKLEKLNWNFFWDSMEFEVENYPESNGAISVFTISLNENWIGS